MRPPPSVAAQGTDIIIHVTATNHCSRWACARAHVIAVAQHHVLCATHLLQTSSRDYGSDHGMQKAINYCSLLAQQYKGAKTNNTYKTLLLGNLL